MGYTLYIRPQARSVSVVEEILTPSATKAKPSLDSALFAAIMKVVQGRDISQIDIDVDALRSSPHAKRALWPQLRKLMKS